MISCLFISDLVGACWVLKQPQSYGFACHQASSCVSPPFDGMCPLTFDLFIVGIWADWASAAADPAREGVAVSCRGVPQWGPSVVADGAPPCLWCAPHGQPHAPGPGHCLVSGCTHPETKTENSVSWYSSWVLSDMKSAGLRQFINYSKFYDLLIIPYVYKVTCTLRACTEVCSPFPG